MNDIYRKVKEHYQKLDESVVPSDEDDSDEPLAPIKHYFSPPFNLGDEAAIRAYTRFHEYTLKVCPDILTTTDPERINFAEYYVNHQYDSIKSDPREETRSRFEKEYLDTIYRQWLQTIYFKKFRLKWFPHDPNAGIIQIVDGSMSAAAPSYDTPSYYAPPSQTGRSGQSLSDFLSNLGDE